MTPRRSFATAALAAAALLTACSGDSESSAPSDASTTTVADDPAAPSQPLVEIERSRFAPQDLTVAVGTEVRFVNLDRATHTATARDDSAFQFDSGNLGKDDDFTQTFTDAGTFDYFCEVHPTMRGTITVE